jgi:hypothetical protein
MLKLDSSNDARRRTALVLAAAVAATATVAAAAPANAAGGGSKWTKAAATCGKVTMKFKSKADTGGVLEVGGELHSTVANQVWSLKIVDNGVTVWKGTRTTLAPTDSLAVGRVIPNRVGVDRLSLRAVSGTTTCSVSLVS